MVRVLLEVVSMGSAAAQASAALVPAFHVPLDRQLARRAHSPASCCRRRRVHEGDRLSGAASLDHIGFGLRAANGSRYNVPTRDHGALEQWLERPAGIQKRYLDYLIAEQKQVYMLTKDILHKVF